MAEPSSAQGPHLLPFPPHPPPSQVGAGVREYMLLLERKYSMMALLFMLFMVLNV